MELQRLFNSIRRMIWLVILLGLIGGGISTYSNYYMTIPMYEAETDIYTISRGSGGSNSDNAGINYQDVMLTRQLIQDYQQIVTSEKVLALATKQLERYDINQEELKGMVYVTPKSDSNIIGISVVAYDSKLAAEASTAVTQAFITRLREITNGSIVGVINVAKEPKLPIPNGNIKNIIIGTLAGIIVAFVIIYIRELFDTTIRFTEDVECNIELKVIGIIPKYSIR